MSTSNLFGLITVIILLSFIASLVIHAVMTDLYYDYDDMSWQAKVLAMMVYFALGPIVIPLAMVLFVYHVIKHFKELITTMHTIYEAHRAKDRNTHP